MDQNQSQLLAHCGSNKLTREELGVIPTPEGTPTTIRLPIMQSSKHCLRLLLSAISPSCVTSTRFPPME